MKTIVFVNPPLQDGKPCEEFSPIAGVDPPFGLCYLASAARQEGYVPFILDAANSGYGLKKTVDEIMKLKPDYIGITSTTFAFRSAVALSRSLKERSGAKIIIGGSHFSALPRETIKYFDIGIMGEGEATLVELLYALENGRPLKGVRGVVYKERGKVIINEPRGLIKDLDQLPQPAFDLLPDIPKYYQPPVQSTVVFPAMSLISSRGCSGHCTFCDRTISGNNVRAHSAEYLFEMIRSLVERYGVKSLMFHDDNFLIFKQRNLKLIKLLKKNGISIKFNCLARVDFISKEYLIELKKGGLWQVNVGVESGSQRMLDFYEKNISLAQIRKAVDVIGSLGIRAKGFIILGGPSETLEDLEMTRRFVNELKLTDIGMTYFTPLPGSDIYDDARKYGKVIGGFDDFSMFRIVFIPKGLDKEDLEYYYNRIYREFYLRPRIILDYIRRISSMRQLIYLAKGLGVFIREVLAGNRKRSTGSTNQWNSRP